MAPQELAALANSDPAVLTVSDQDMSRALAWQSPRVTLS